MNTRSHTSRAALPDGRSTQLACAFSLDRLEPRLLLSSSIATSIVARSPSRDDARRPAAIIAQAIQAVQTNVVITEGMGSVPTIRLHLAARPTGNVTVSLSRISGDGDIAVLDSSAVFTTSNWRADKYIRLQAAADGDDVNGEAVIRASASGFTPLDIIAVEKDDDRPQAIEVSTTSLAVTEGRTNSFRVRLTARPANTLTVQTAKLKGDSDLSVEAHSALTFSSGNWDKWQWVSLAGRADADAANGAATFAVTANAVATQTISAIEQDTSQSAAVYNVLVDDYEAMPLQGDASDFSTVNRMGGNRGKITSNGEVDFPRGYVEARLTGNGLAGVFSSLNHDLNEHLPLNAQAMLPVQIKPEFQYRATAVTAEIIDGIGTFQLELKDTNNGIVWSGQVTLTGGPRSIRLPLPPTLGNIQLLNWIVVGNAGTFAQVKRVGLETAGPQIGHMEDFLWPYAGLLSNFNLATGFTRDSSAFASGVFDAINGTGALAGATAMAQQLGIITTQSAQQIVTSIANALLTLQANASINGVLPHFIRSTPNGFRILPGTEYSSIDSAIALIHTLLSSQHLGLPTAPLEQAFRNINWSALVLPNGMVSHGYTESGARLGQGWDYFGGESLMTALAFAAAQGTAPAIPNINAANPVSFNGSGFIDELLWVAMSPAGRDVYGADWDLYRTKAAMGQIARYDGQPAPVFGASAGEAPIPYQVTSTYEAYGVGGATGGNDGSGAFVAPIETPHYAGMIYSLFPADAQRMFDYMTQSGMLSPLNNVESMTVQTWGGQVENHWNSLKGSWNLGLMALGAGKGLLATRGGSPLAAAAENNAFIRAGRQRIAASTQNLNVNNRIAILDAPRTFDSITLSNGGNLIVREGGSNTLLTKAISLTSSVLDLNDNDMIVDYDSGSPLAAVQGLINSARAGGAWLGFGITSTSASNRNPKNTTLGVMEAAEYRNLAPANTTFSGRPIDTTAVLIKYTYYGDANFTGRVNFDDYTKIDAGFNNQATGWLNGDFNGGGRVNFDDYTLIDGAFNSQSEVL